MRMLHVAVRQLPLVVLVGARRGRRSDICIGKLSAVAAVLDVLLPCLHPRWPDHTSSHVVVGRLRAVAADDAKDHNGYDDDEQKYESKRQPDDEHSAEV